jgi:acyl-CoA thioester hydrolase
MRVGGELVATEELMCLHVASGSASPFPDDVAERLHHYAGPVPDYAGRAIA